MVRIDDILAALLLSLIMFRRLEALSVRQEDNPGVPPEKFQYWRSQTLAAYRLGAFACVAKVVFSLAWLWLVAGNVRLQVIGGLTIFVAWIAAIVLAWRKATEANVLRRALGIQRGEPSQRDKQGK